ncbi:unnamed protein product [Clonostachys rhizophaga]|uniref:Uncharacterized protein n=1 Tax=Clonostachys rhizophaga TaxID=160324 RepID=A0A9N9VIQ3_9HYPO|nr:unnamed protein product [Clonostachys rhizophaga]
MEHIDLDMTICATGFDAIKGAYDAIDITSINGISLKDCPHQIFVNISRSIEYAVEWVSGLIEHYQKNHISCVEATTDRFGWWTQHAYDCAEEALFSKIDSWMTGINANVACKQTGAVARDNGTATQFRTKCGAIAADKHTAFKLAA